mmetsp:Transcript_37992/g.86174  ORF Transcript_37992/g.86174 Transcript_37992/m.86174 type:complete len:267 (-) Transcript_37992:1210-2010(-)
MNERSVQIRGEMLSLQEVFPLLERVSKSPETLECVKEIAEARAERDEARAKLEHTQLQDAWARSSALEQQLADAQAEIGHLRQRVGRKDALNELQGFFREFSVDITHFLKEANSLSEHAASQRQIQASTSHLAVQLSKLRFTAQQVTETMTSTKGQQLRSACVSGAAGILKDDAVIQIMVNLRVPELLKSRAVCHSWQRLFFEAEKHPVVRLRLRDAAESTAHPSLPPALRPATRELMAHQPPFLWAGLVTSARRYRRGACGVCYV